MIDGIQLKTMINEELEIRENEFEMIKEGHLDQNLIIEMEKNLAERRGLLVALRKLVYLIEKSEEEIENGEIH